MENNPTYHSDEAEKDDKKDSDKSSGFKFGPAFQPVERPVVESPRTREYAIPVVPTEGIISWRDPSEERIHIEEVDEADAAEEHAEAPEDEEEESDKKGKAKPKPFAVPLGHISEAAAPAPLDILAEVADEKKGEPEESTDDGSHPTDIFVREETASPQGTEAVRTDSRPTAEEPIDVVSQEDEPPEPASRRPAPTIVPPVAPRPEYFTSAPAASTETTPTEPPTPPLPPTPPGIAGGFDAPAERPAVPYGYDPNLYPAASTGGMEYNTTNAPVMPIEHPQAAANRDPRLGPVAATLGLGLVAEHIGRKRADHKLEQRVNDRIEHQAGQQEQQFTTASRAIQEQQQRFVTEQQRQADELQRMHQVQERFGTLSPAAEQPMPPIVPALESAPSGPAPTVERPPIQRPDGQAFNSPQPTEQMRPPEAIGMASNQVELDSQYNDNTELKQHVKHSAWHNIVVNSRDQEIAGAINYGEGFRKERQQEIIRDRIADSVGSGSSGAAGVGGPQSGYGASSDSFYPGSALPSGMTSPSLPQGQPPAADPQHQLPEHTKQGSGAGPWFWVMLLLVIAAFFTAALI